VDCWDNEKARLFSGRTHNDFLEAKIMFSKKTQYFCEFVNEHLKMHGFAPKDWH